MQLDILLFFQKIHSSFLDALMNMISMAGEIAVPLVVLCITYWCVSKKKGFIILSSLMSALVVTQVTKSIVRAPRPFQVYHELIEGGRIETATGYSFPSGHSTTGAAFYSSLAYVYRKKWLAVLSVILILAIPASRLYLGVHWPLDVAAGTAIGLAAGLLLSSVFSHIYDDKSLLLRFTLISGLILTAAAAVTAVLLSMSLADETAFSDLMSNSAVAAGALLGCFAEQATLGFDASSMRWNRKAVRFAAGIVFLAVIAIVISVLPLPHHAKNALLFFAVGISATYVYPLLAVRIGLAERE